jgi:CheY-like chemotaxis protein/MinD-like ATPase involved in chromosome partitioning or flagellar assembly
MEATMATKILVVDDEIESVKLIGLMLQRRGYEIAAARTGVQALEKARSENPDLIILDVMMPDMDGYEVCRRLRADPAMAAVPIIMFTAKTMIDDKVAGFQAGADDYLTKPVHPEELASRIEAVLLRTSRPQSSVEEKPEARAKVIGFLGSKGGVGTTTLAVNVAVSLIQDIAEDKQVILADIQSGMAGSSLNLGLRRQGGVWNLLDHPVGWIDSRMVEAQLEEHKTGVRVLGGQLEPIGVAEPVLPSYAEALIQHLGAMSDYLLLDLGVGLGETNRHVLSVCDHIVVTTEPHRVALTLTRSLLDEMASALKLPRHRISVVLINKSTSVSTFTKEAAEDLIQNDLAGVITPAAELAFQGAETGIPMVTAQPNALVAQQIRKLAEDLSNV